MTPLPTDLAGYQHIENGVCREDDLMIPIGCLSAIDWMWAGPYANMAIRDGCLGDYRVYRKMPVPKQDGDSLANQA